MGSYGTQTDNWLIPYPVDGDWGYPNEEESRERAVDLQGFYQYELMETDRERYGGVLMNNNGSFASLALSGVAPPGRWLVRGVIARLAGTSVITGFTNGVLNHVMIRKNTNAAWTQGATFQAQTTAPPPSDGIKIGTLTLNAGGTVTAFTDDAIKLRPPVIRDIAGTSTVVGGLGIGEEIEILVDHSARVRFAGGDQIRVGVPDAQSFYAFIDAGETDSGKVKVRVKNVNNQANAASNFDVTVNRLGISDGTVVASGAITVTQRSIQGDRYRQFVDDWFQNNVAASQNNALLTRLAAGPFASSWIPTRRGSVSGLFIKSNEARTAGTASVDVYVNGTAIGRPVVIDGTNPTAQVRTFAAGTSTFLALDELDLRVTTGSDWTPTTADVRGGIEIQS